MSINKIIDAHCHLDFDVFTHDIEEVLRRAKQNNISDIIIPGTQRKHWPRITTLTKNYNMLHSAYGLHPYWCDEHNATDIYALEQYLSLNPHIAIGECGLDFRRQQAEKKLQLYYFEAQLKMAEQFQLPAIIHSVHATEVVIQSIKKFKNCFGMIHSYSGSIEQAKQLIDLNFFISFSGSVTHENAKTIRATAKAIPLASLLIETDAPDQSGVKHIGKRNEPAFIQNTIEVITQLRDESLEAIVLQTCKNTKQLFNL